METQFRDLHVFADDREIGQGCRMRLNARENLSLLPQLFYLEIENLSGSSSALISACRKLEVRSNDSVLASGEIVTCCPRRHNGKQILSVSFSLDFGFWESSVSLSMAAGMRVSDTIRAVLAASMDLSGSRGQIPLAAFSAEDIQTSRPQEFFGRTCDVIRLLADTVDADAYLSTAGLCIIGHKPMEPTLFIPEDDLLSDPVFLKDRIILTTSMIGWPLGTCVEFSDGGNMYQGLLVSQLLQLDNASGLWMSQLEIITEGG